MASELTVSLLFGVGLQPAPRAVVEALTDLTVTIGAGGTSPSGFELKFATSKLSQITTQLLPGGYFDPPTRIVIVATLDGSATVLMDGVITQQDVVPSDESGRSVLSVKGQDLSKMMDIIDFGSLICYPAMPAELRVALIIAKYAPLYGIVPLVIPSVLINVPLPTETIPNQQGTDLAYVNTLADSVGYIFYVQPGPVAGMSYAYWGPRLQVAIPFLQSAAPPPLAIDWDGRSNVESLQFSFDGFKKTLFFITVKVTDLPVPLPIPIPDVTPLSPPMGEKDPQILKVSPVPGVSGYDPLYAAAIGLAKAADAANVVSGQGTLDVLRYGAILPPRTMVTVRGAGITFDGDYFVSGVTHTIKPGSYKQSFTLVRNRLIAAGADPLSPAAYGLGQQLPGFSTAPVGAASAPALPTPSTPLPVLSPGSPSAPATGGATAATTLPSSP